MTASDLARVRWRCRRGMRELDAVLFAFVDRAYGELSEQDKSTFERVLDLPDPELFAYVTGRREPADPDIARIVAHVRRVADPRA
ncbi:MAG TPA: succinate dehydrogenase assembly factor 2 [Gammaproteobacteria bacterium]